MTTIIKPSLGAVTRHSFGSNACFKAVNIGGPTPTQITDTSGRNNHGAFTTAPDVAQTSTGLWTYQFVSASSEYVTIPDITELLGATAATWLAWVRKDALVSGQVIASDYATNRRWLFGETSTENMYFAAVRPDDVYKSTSIAGVFTAGWHFCWVRFRGDNASGLEAGCDNSVATPTSTAGLAALLATTPGAIYIGRYSTTYSSITLAGLNIFPRALTNDEIQQWRWRVKAQAGI